jgi:3-oxoadipate enol-lactonase
MNTNFPMRSSGYDFDTSVNGLQIRYDDLGPIDAPTLIFIHGFPLDKSMWQRQMVALQADYRVVAYDVRGHGRSEAGHEDFSIDLFAYDLLCLMETLRIDQAALCGHSMGGYIALHAVENYPNRFNGLILCDTNCIADTHALKEGRVETMEEILEDGIEAYADDCLARYFALGSSRHHTVEREAVRAMIEGTSSESLCNTLFALSGRRETCSKLLEIGIPALIMVGEEDIVTPPAAAYTMHAKIRGSVLALIANAAHLPNLENTVQFNAHLLEFMYQAFPIGQLVKR